MVIHRNRLVLASASSIRAQILKNAGLAFETYPAKIDEELLIMSLKAENANGRDISDALAEEKAKKVSNKYPDSIVLGCDQVLEFENTIFSKPVTEQEAVEQLSRLSGQSHRLLSALVLYEAGKPVWRHIGLVNMTMRNLSDTYIRNYVSRNWQSIRHSVGAYKLEEEGVRLFSKIEGDYFTILGLPIIELLTYLEMRGVIET